jgi:hypothetical protein
MDPVVIVMVAVACSLTVGFIVKAIADSVVRVRELRDAHGGSHLEQRLERMETAIDAIAVEIERMGELQRFTARLAPSPTDREPSRLARPVTPTPG